MHCWSEYAIVLRPAHVHAHSAVGTIPGVTYLVEAKPEQHSPTDGSRHKLRCYRREPRMGRCTVTKRLRIGHRTIEPTDTRT